MTRGGSDYRGWDREPPPEISSSPTRRVARLDHVDCGPCEHPADFGSVVDRQDEPALEAPEHLREPGEVAPVEHLASVVGLVAHIGRVDIEERGGPVVSRDEGGPVETFDMDALQAAMGGANQGAHARGGEPA